MPRIEKLADVPGGDARGAKRNYHSIMASLLLLYLSGERRLPFS